MTDSLTIGWTVAQQEKALRTYKRVLGFNMILHVIIGIACIAFPYWVSSVVGLPSPMPSGWVRGWGATLILVTALYVPGLKDPLVNTAPNMIGVFGRYWMTAIWIACGGGFLWFALFDGFFATLIGFLYLRLFKAQLMTYP
jgi:hypothetical protein